ncbi:MAG: ABC transporter ATP-binding protein [Chloroflexota bacterium]|nr:ABC transporter ATP-binding protein [Chloroflexota bacterium]
MTERRRWRGPSADDRTTGWGVERICVRYGSTLALDRVSLAVGEGAVTAVVGADGAGKTTLLRTLVGSVRPASGRARRPDKHRIGYVSAGPGVYRDLTVDENLSFVARAYGVTGASGRLRIDELLERTELSTARRQLAGLLSGGMRQKLALAMAVVHRPELLVLDEPTTGVDPVSRAELWRLIGALAADGTAIAMATTYVDEAERAATVLVLLRGRTLAAGTPDAILSAVPGELYQLAASSRSPLAWRRGAAWRQWSPDGAAAPGAQLIEPDLEDALVIAQLAAESSGGGGEAAA